MRWTRTATKGYDPTFGDDVLRAAVANLMHGDWAAVETWITTCREPWLASAVLHDDEVSIPLNRFEEWAAASGSGIAVAHLGQAQITTACRSRAGAGSDHHAAERFADGMARAEATLLEATRLDPSAAEPWAGLVITGRGLHLPFGAIEDRFVQVHAREPFRFDACHQMMRAMSARGGGSHNAMFEFVRWLNGEAPADAAARCLVHLAHFEYALSDAETGLTLGDYLALPEVAAELKKVAHDYLRTTPSDAKPEHLQALNLILLMVLPTDTLSGRVVRESINRIADRPTAVPWSSWGDDIHRRFRTVRDERAKAAKFV